MPTSSPTSASRSRTCPDRSFLGKWLDVQTSIRHQRLGSLSAYAGADPGFALFHIRRVRFVGRHPTETLEHGRYFELEFVLAERRSAAGDTWRQLRRAELHE